MRGFVHHEPREADWALDGLDARDRAALERGAVHDGCVEFVSAVVGEDRALAGVEVGVFFERGDDLLHGVECGAAAGELITADLKRGGEGVGILGTLCGRRDFLQDARAAVDGDGPGAGRGGGVC